METTSLELYLYVDFLVKSFPLCYIPDDEEALSIEEVENYVLSGLVQ